MDWCISIPAVLPTPQALEPVSPATVTIEWRKEVNSNLKSIKKDI